MKVIELRAELQARGLDTKGKCLDLPSEEKANNFFINIRCQSRPHRPLKGSIGFGARASWYVFRLRSAICIINLSKKICKEISRNKLQSSLFLNSAHYQ